MKSLGFRHSRVAVILLALLVAAAVASTAVATNWSSLGNVKLRAAQRQKAQDLASQLHSVRKANLPGPPAAVKIAPRVSSIQVIHDSPMPGMMFGTNNMWQGAVGGVWLLAYAGMYNRTGGASTAPTAYVPAIALWSEPLNPNAANQTLRKIGIYPAHGAETSFGITAAKGTVLRLKGVGPGSNGQSLLFNLATTYVQPLR